MSKYVFGCAVLLILVAVVVGAIAFSQYNGLVSADEAVSAQWSQVENVYQRRADLIPNLVATVKGAADFEQETLTRVVEARSRVGQIDASNALSDPGTFEAFQQAQGELSSALSRLLVVVERYPELRAVAAFQDLMVQLEGTENRISVERRRFNEVARSYNTRVRQVPARWLIGALGWPFEPRPYFEAEEGADQVPEVDFS